MKKFILSLTIIMGCSASFIGLSSFSTPDQEESKSDVFIPHVTSEGRHCNGIVGCDCPGFAPITNGKVWQQAYCRHCGHSRSCHK